MKKDCYLLCVMLCNEFQQKFEIKHNEELNIVYVKNNQNSFLWREINKIYCIAIANGWEINHIQQTKDEMQIVLI